MCQRRAHPPKARAVPRAFAKGEEKDHSQEKMGSNMYETVKRKLGMGAKIAHGGGVHKAFRQLFGSKEEEKLLKVSQCSLSTTAGPISGLLFISTDKIGFCSKRSIRFTCLSGKLIRTPYKNMKKPTQKYLEIVTVDGFDFWFMGFINYPKTFKYLQQAVSQI
ncbi:hypothetical protein ACHQM5_004985 [Ranunculus cassubicifolius]